MQLLLLWSASIRQRLCWLPSTWSTSSRGTGSALVWSLDLGRRAWNKKPLSFINPFKLNPSDLRFELHSCLRHSTQRFLQAVLASSQNWVQDICRRVHVLRVNRKSKIIVIIKNQVLLFFYHQLTSSGLLLLGCRGCPCSCPLGNPIYSLQRTPKRPFHRQSFVAPEACWNVVKEMLILCLPTILLCPYNLFCPIMSMRKSIKYAGTHWKSKTLKKCSTLFVVIVPLGYQTPASKGFS